MRTPRAERKDVERDDLPTYPHDVFYMEAFSKVLTLNNEVEAELVDGVLTDRGIPHRMRSYHDSALDGLFQGQYGWGHVEAPERCHAEIVALVQEIQRQADAGGPE